MDNTKPLPNRRAFVKKALLGLAALGTTTQAQAFSLTNPGRDAKDPRHIGQKGVETYKGTFFPMRFKSSLNLS